jgi:dTDP-4-dehydrorhamnose 3,5-epimerase
LEFSPTPLRGVSIVDSVPHEDPRGSFGRIWCREEFGRQQLPSALAQVSLSRTAKKGTLRGMHFQLAPSREDKLVRCVRGRIFDVALDLRRRSPSYLSHVGVELGDGGMRGLFIPAGCAHGFLTLEPDCVVLYMMTDVYSSGLQAGVRWDDPAFAIAWPERPAEVLERDAQFPDFDPGIVDGFSDY